MIYQEKCACGFIKSADGVCHLCTSRALYDSANKILYLLNRSNLTMLRESDKRLRSCSVDAEGFVHSRGVWSDAAGGWDLYMFQRARAVPVTEFDDEGHGYSGGHNTAERRGWDTSYKPPRPGAVLHWTYANVGHCTGFYPHTISIVPTPRTG